MLLALGMTTGSHPYIMDRQPKPTLKQPGTLFYHMASSDTYKLKKMKF